jgi:hypothetical protein
MPVALAVLSFALKFDPWLSTPAEAVPRLLARARLPSTWKLVLVWDPLADPARALPESALAEFPRAWKFVPVSVSAAEAVPPLVAKAELPASR